ncbi:hypothetical protein Csa_013339 [Cucumis sativus]|uniref:Uncharacterized protein n=1 Tax=Cucumis sativus TaxID=3659 RepID=A0A0A0LNZ9_CUCSA|nr:hypothetical protein Csa_013339 [Cucumis sativus]
MLHLGITKHLIVFNNCSYVKLILPFPSFEWSSLLPSQVFECAKEIALPIALQNYRFSDLTSLCQEEDKSARLTG